MSDHDKPPAGPDLSQAVQHCQQIIPEVANRDRRRAITPPVRANVEHEHRQASRQQRFGQVQHRARIARPAVYQDGDRRVRPDRLRFDQ
jgi:hypothetical protein